MATGVPTGTRADVKRPMMEKAQLGRPLGADSWVSSASVAAVFEAVDHNRRHEHRRQEKSSVTWKPAMW